MWVRIPTVSILNKKHGDVAQLVRANPGDWLRISGQWYKRHTCVQCVLLKGYKM
jgi:hypothetical protein